MPPEPVPWDRKDFFKERKHERSESLGPFNRWRDSSASSHHGGGGGGGPRSFVRWGSGDFRRTPGHSKQGGWHMFPDDSGHGYMPLRSADKFLDEEGGRRPGFRGDGKYGRNYRDSRGSFGQRDWRVGGGHCYETSNASPQVNGRLTDVSNNQRSVDVSVSVSAPPPVAVNAWDSHQLHSKDQHDKSTGVSGSSPGQKCDRENSAILVDWKPLKWSRSGSRGSGLSHSSSSKSMGVDSSEVKTGIVVKNVTPIQSPSGDAAACVTSSAPSEEMMSRKKPRLGWGEGLAKYEKKKVEGPEETESKSCMEPVQFHHLIVAEKSPRVAGFSDCASPATPSSVACSSSPGLEEKTYGKMSNQEHDVSNLCESPCPSSQVQQESCIFNLEGTVSMSNLGQLIELLQGDGSNSPDSGFIISTALSKLLVLKGHILKELEVTESEVDSLENELKLLVPESGGSCQYTGSSSPPPVGEKLKPGEEQDDASNMMLRPVSLQPSCSGAMVENGMPFGEAVVEEAHDVMKDEDVDSPGTATSKFVEQPLVMKPSSPPDIIKSPEDLDVAKPTESGVRISVDSREVELPASVCGVDGKNDEPTNDAVLCADSESIQCQLLLSENTDAAKQASEAFRHLLPIDQAELGTSRAGVFACQQHDSLILEKFARRKQFLKFKEKVITLKFKALSQLWKEDMRLLSLKKTRAKSQKKSESTLRITFGGIQKHRSSTRSRLPSSVGNLSLVPSNEVVSQTRKLLLDSQMKLYRNSLKMPALILDQKEKNATRFVNSNGLIEDPCSFEKEKAMINPWTVEEKEIFLDKLLIHGKDFRKIASFFDHKTTADCVEFYYKNHKSDFFKRTMKKLNFGKQDKSLRTNTYLVTSEKKWNREVSAVSLDVLGDVSVAAAQAYGGNLEQRTCPRRFCVSGHSSSRTIRGDYGISERVNSCDLLGSERETVAADVLAGICSSLSSEAMSSCVTSSLEPGDCREMKCQKVDTSSKWLLTFDDTQNVEEDTCSGESAGEMESADWTDEEKSIFVQAVSSYGKDFEMIADRVKTKSVAQCKVFFSKARKCLSLDQLHSGTTDVGTSGSDDANGGGSVTEDACNLETGSVVCGDEMGSKMDLDLPLPVGKSDLVHNLNLQKPVSHSEEKAVSGQLESENFETVGVPDICHTMEEHVLNSGDADPMTESMKCKKCAAPSVDGTGKDCIGGPSVSQVESVYTQEDVDAGPVCTTSVADTEAVSHPGVEGLVHGPHGQERGPNNDVKTDAQSVHPVINDMETGSDSNVAADTNGCLEFCLQSVSMQEASVGLNAFDKPLICSLPEVSQVILSPSTSQNSSTVAGELSKNQEKILSPALDLPVSTGRSGTASSNDHQEHISGFPLSNHVDSPQILRGYPIVMAKKDLNGGSGSVESSDGSLDCRFGMLNSCLRKCNGTVSHSSMAELPLLPQSTENTNNLPNAHVAKDREKQSGTGDIKLFGQILSHPSSQSKHKGSIRETDDKGTPLPGSGVKSSNPKCTSNFGGDGTSASLKFDFLSHLGIDNFPVRSYGFWDGNKIQTGFSSLPDSTLLMAKYPAAFCNYALSSSKAEQQSLPGMAKTNECRLNGVPPLPPASSNGIGDYHICRSVDDAKLQSFSVDEKSRQDVLSEMQRCNGLEALSSLQQQGVGMIPMNVMGRGVLVGGPCNGVADPVAAIKLHYAQSDQFVGQNGNMTREEESWRGKGDLGR